MSSVFVAIAIVVSPVAWFAWGPTRAFPGQHMVNVLAGVMVGPLLASVCALTTGTVRIILGLGTIFAYPGGIPGGVMVGLLYKLLKNRVGIRSAILLASLGEPLGTVLVGGTVSWYVVDPLLGTGLQSRFGALLVFYLGWTLSSISGCVVGVILLLALERLGVLKYAY